MNRQHPNVQFKTHEGFLLYTDMSDNAMDYMAAIPVNKLKIGNGASDKKMSEHEIEKAKSYLLSPAEVAMYGVMKQMIGHRVFYEPQRSVFKRHWIMGMTHAEYSNAKRYTEYQSGIDDFQFTWQFAPAVASNVVREYVATDQLGPEQVDNFTLGDWANIIGSGWFASLCHDLAIAKEGTYGSFGTGVHDFCRDGLLTKLFPLDEDKMQVFDLENYYEPFEGVLYKGARMNEEARKLLRRKRSEKSLGCPVARAHTTVDVDVIENDRHTQRLLNSGRITLSEKTVKAGRQHLQLQYTAIDRTLALMADKFDEYEQQFGTPRAMKTPKGYKWVHLAMEASNVLQTKLEPNVWASE